MAVKPKVRKVFTIRQLWARAGAIVVLSVFCAVVIAPEFINRGFTALNGRLQIGWPLLPVKPFNLGLDLRGGAHLIYEANVSRVPAADRSDAVEGVRDVVERRVRGGLGVAEPLVQTTRVGEAYRVIVELPGVTDIATAIKMIGETPVLEFKEENIEPPRQLTTPEKQELAKFNAGVERQALEGLGQARAGKDFTALARELSADSATKEKGGDLGFIFSDQHPELYAWAKGQRDGAVSPTLIKTAAGLNIAKRLGARATAKRVQAAHLLLCYPEAEFYRQAQAEGNTQVPPCTSAYTKESAKSKTEELKGQATPQNFADLVKQYSTEPGAGERGGSLGWIRQGQVVPAFEAAVWNAATGTMIGPVETQFGWHLIFKQAEEPIAEYQVARVLFKLKSESELLPPPEPWKFTGLSGKQLKRAEVVTDQRTGQIQVSLQFNDEGSKLFGDITSRNVNKQVAIFLDGSPISEPRVNEPILSGSAVISGDFGLPEAKLLSQRLNSGALPVPVELISQSQVDATLGAGSLAKSFKAGVAGLILVAIFMLLYYRLPGALAVLSLGVYALLNLAIFKLIGVTLTLAGVAGFILSIGMAVDANILVFERLKEELRLGKALKTAREESFVRAWPSIRDGHVTGLISCLLLIWFGSGFIQGFAVVLGIGTLVSLFTAITVTRIIMRLVFGWFTERGSSLFLGYRKGEAETALSTKY